MTSLFAYVANTEPKSGLVKDASYNQLAQDQYDLIIPVSMGLWK